MITHKFANQFGARKIIVYFHFCLLNKTVSFLLQIVSKLERFFSSFRGKYYLRYIDIALFRGLTFQEISLNLFVG
jgi:hypothetical protein